MIGACDLNGLIKDDGSASVLATIKSGFTKGKQNPRHRAVSSGYDPRTQDDNPTTTRHDSREVTLLRASDIRVRAISWLWEPVLARGKVSMIAGDPGVAKSHVAIAIAAIVSTGGRWPASTQHAKPGNVIIISAEDDAADTIVPGLMAAGADLTKVFVLGHLGHLFDLEQALARACNTLFGVQDYQADADLDFLTRGTSEVQSGVSVWSRKSTPLPCRSGYPTVTSTVTSRTPVVSTFPVPPQATLTASSTSRPARSSTSEPPTHALRENGSRPRKGAASSFSAPLTPPVSKYPPRRAVRFPDIDVNRAGRQRPGA